MDILEYGDYSVMNNVVSRYPVSREDWTYRRMLEKVYRLLVKNYCCEYVVKNEIISRLLIKNFGTKDTVYFSEFRLLDSIADLALFNGESKAFEIKTVFDSPRRLKKQLDEYCGFFDKVYIVVPGTLLDSYMSIIDSTVGIVTYDNECGSMAVDIKREAGVNEHLNVDVVMAALREQEYISIVKQITGKVPDVPFYEMYGCCLDLMSRFDVKKLKASLLEAIKMRRNITSRIKQIDTPLRQMMLSLNLPSKKEALLIDKLNVQISY